MEYLGKIHEMALYTLLTSIVLIALGRPHFIFFGLALAFFLLIAIIGAICTKHFDDGEGLTFKSDNIVVIMFAHVAEDLLGLILTPIWLIRDLITHNFNDDAAWKIFDYVSYFIEIITALITIAILYYVDIDVMALLQKLAEQQQ